MEIKVHKLLYNDHWCVIACERISFGWHNWCAFSEKKILMSISDTTHLVRWQWCLKVTKNCLHERMNLKFTWVMTLFVHQKKASISPRAQISILQSMLLYFSCAFDTLPLRDCIQSLLIFQMYLVDRSSLELHTRTSRTKRWL